MANKKDEANVAENAPEIKEAEKKMSKKDATAIVDHYSNFNLKSVPDDLKEARKVLKG